MRDLAGGRVTRRDMRREATKAAVLEAAEKVFLSQGYEGATIKAIADEAGVSPGTVLNAEPSKAALLMAILSNEVEMIAESVEQMEAALSGNLADRIIALLQIMLEGQSRNSELFAAAVGHSWMVADPTYQAAFDQMELAWRPIRRVVETGISEGELRRDVDVDTLIAVLSDLFLGAMRAARRSEFEERPIVSLEARVRVVIEGMLAR
ncbi:MAG: TetR/AcrR family transcriptional regulator [Oceanicaulis sp.]|jgi:AcrR family transcriptional regulator|nr:transcriptional regulator, TetR family protein [Oceanicaulis alexandrii HTCC2633] [Oceanicaulis sp. HTCC2633]MAB68783.1 TetR/AcrR family transcriptional regulator [Oceanicaulis sp.]MBC37961.1 TetR/AcrR family transcriptional regulator [Oceanicaulis sp.]MBG35581.1 TetR/AcrR family transcriptional regulator [Oceanicaulis sp.]HBU61424.1 TetR/AcrR family transcriptional regulator [Oceanicaulis sp.]|tara:strand:- start:62 stop:685 length:624 start_codon:yes stop_codon:yes gene_type:complete